MGRLLGIVFVDPARAGARDSGDATGRALPTGRQLAMVGRAIHDGWLTMLSAGVA